MGLRGGLAGIAHKPDDDVRLVAAADLDPEALGRFREKYGDEAFTTSDYRELIDQKLDAVFVLSPDFLHEEQASTLLEAGVAVYLEKPMAITVEGCDRILATAKKSGAKLYVGHNMRHFAVVRKMKEWIDQGLIGEVKAAWCRHFVAYGGEAYFQDWHADRSKSTGLLLQKGAHDIDVMHWLCGGYSQSVTAFGDLMVYGQIQERLKPGEKHKVKFTSAWPPLSLKPLNQVVDVEDLNMMLMKLDNGVLASYQHCHFAPDAWRNYTFIGTEGRIENFGDEPGNAIVRLWDHANLQWSEHGDLEYRVPKATGGHGGADELIVGEFIRFLREGGKTDTSPVAARQAVAAGCMATESLRQGGAPKAVPAIDPALVAYFESGQRA